jgi:putative peptide zinc metalloprotease protein
MSHRSLVSSSSRPLKVRLRRDLVFVRQTWQGRDYWIVKDPLALRFYRFEDEEFALLRMLDGQHSADEIRRQFAERFAPQRITHRELFQFIGSLYRSSLLISDAPRQAVPLQQRARENRRREWTSKLSNVLAVRLQGFDPDGLLRVLNRYFGWIFSRPMVVIMGLFVISAVALVLTHFEQFQHKLPGYQEFFIGNNWLALAVVLAATKVLHELGHGVACKRFGSQCHSMGIMFLVLMPCLYCDVSDSWTLKSKWRRAAIAAAGMYVEFILASVCAFLWWFSEPGWVNMLALNVVVVCSISTLLFNANPLLKFDGYYILADLIEVPNLRTKASRVLRRFSCQWMLGIEPQPDPFMPPRHRWLFGLYSILAFAYRWFITLSIFWFLYNLLEPWGLKIIGQAIALMALWGLAGLPLWQLFRFLSVPGRISTVQPFRFGITAVFAVLVLAGVMWIPVPHDVTCSFIVQHADAATVYVEMPGKLRTIRTGPAEHVQSGQDLLVLENPGLLEAITRLEGEEEIARQKYYSAKQQSHYDEAAQAGLDALLASWQAISRQLEQRRHDVARLQVQSPIDGKVISASWVSEPETDDGQLATWYGHPLEVRNCGAWLEEGTVVCQIAPAEAPLQAILAIDQADIEFVASGNRVRLWFRQQPNRLHESRIDLISPVAMEIVPRALSQDSGGDLATVPGPDGKPVPRSTTYQVRVNLDESAGMIANGSTGIARIRTGNQTVGSRLWRFLCKTFRFDL